MEIRGDELGWEIAAVNGFTRLSAAPVAERFTISFSRRVPRSTWSVVAEDVSIQIDRLSDLADWARERAANAWSSRGAGRFDAITFDLASEHSWICRIGFAESAEELGADRLLMGPGEMACTVLLADETSTCDLLVRAAFVVSITSLDALGAGIVRTISAQD